jgi:hypothetical protein
MPEPIRRNVAAARTVIAERSADPGPKNISVSPHTAPRRSAFEIPMRVVAASHGGRVASAQFPNWSDRVEHPLVATLFYLAAFTTALAIWRIANDLGVDMPFLFNSGLASHWQIWFAVSALFVCGATLLSRRLRPLRRPNFANRTQAA